MGQGLGLEEALDIAMDAELKAQAFYAQAALEVEDPNGRDLLGRLAAFEQYHYQKLSELTQSLQRDGQFIEYEAQTVEQFVPVVAHGETAGMLLDELKDMPSILSKAIENEKVAGERYKVLAETTVDPAGQDMFRKLANEEMIHQRILEDEFFSLSNQGVWGWSGMYGE
ncbi:MAG TPA: ferritin family protein [Anaerolineae bacterium]|nr:ferritin family protein [Anaerolineae bacterium]